MTTSSSRRLDLVEQVEDSSTVPPASAKPRSRPRIQRMPSGSRPLAGSSRIAPPGRRAAHGRCPSRCRMPREYVPDPALGLGVGQADQLEHLVDACARQAHDQRAEGEHLAAGAAGVLRGRVEQDADVAPGCAASR